MLQFICLSIIFTGVWSQMQELGLSPTDLQRLLDLHNGYRAKVARGEVSGQPPAANMIALEYDDHIAVGAQQWAAACQHHHNTIESRNMEPFNMIGQNMANGFGIDDSYQHWFAEKKNFNYQANRCNGVCGHYWQLTWASVNYIGCGWSACMSGGNMKPMLICNYGGGRAQIYTRPGEVVSGTAAFAYPLPYIEGNACSKCPLNYKFCMDEALCASEQACAGYPKCRCTLKKDCKHGKFNERTCKCDCFPSWEGEFCETSCSDLIGVECTGREHSCQNIAGGWPFMVVNCRRFCGFCGKNVWSPKDPQYSNRKRLITRITNVPNYGNYPVLLNKKPKATERPFVRGNCKNKMADSKCDMFARQNLCHNKEYEATLKIQCPSSCNMCGAGGPSRQQGNCKNRHGDEECNRNAVAGQCEQLGSKSWMSLNCARSCNTCSEVAPRPVGNCKNMQSDAHCKIWADTNQCTANADWMKKNCARSCNSC